MARNRRKHGKKKPGSADPITTPSTIDTSKTRDTNSNTSDHTVMAPTSGPHSFDSNAARKFFNTIELLALTLEYLPIKNLSRALSASKHFRHVIFGSPKLRQELFLGSSQRKEYLRTKRTNNVPINPLRSRNGVIVPELDEGNQDDKIIVKTHPVLGLDRESYRLQQMQVWYCVLRPITDYRSPPLGCKSDIPFLETAPIFCKVMEHVPAETLLFQPAVANVNMYHHRHLVPLERSEGVTFGMVAEELGMIHAEDTQHFQKIMESVVKLPCTPANRRAYARAKNLLDRSRGGNMGAVLGRPCLHFEAEDAISQDFITVRMVRHRMDTAG